MDIREMREQVQQKASLKAKLQELQKQKEMLREELRELEYAKQKEQADVEKLENGGLGNFIYQILGRKDEKLDQEKREAYAAVAKYETALQQLESVKKDIADLERSLMETGDIEQQLTAALQQKKEQLQQSGDEKGRKILELEERVAWLENQNREIEEAISAGAKAVYLAEQIASELKSAHGWGVFDLAGGGLVADIVKHSHLDNAQSQVNNLQSELRNFKKELADVSMNDELKVQIDGFLKFADFFWDGLFTDILVLDKITGSQQEIQNCQKNLESTMIRLNAMKTDTLRQIQSNKDALQTLIANA